MTEFMKPRVLWARLAASVHKMSSARMWANEVNAPGSCGGVGAGTGAVDVGGSPWVSALRVRRIAVFQLN